MKTLRPLTPSLILASALTTCIEITFDTNVSVEGGLVEVQTLISSFLADVVTTGCARTTEVLLKNAVSLAKFRTCELDREAKEAQREEYLAEIAEWEVAVKVFAAERMSQIASLDAEVIAFNNNAASTPKSALATM